MLIYSNYTIHHLLH